MHDIARIREFAFQSIGRGCMFALLAIATVVSGLVWAPVLAAKSGALLMTLACAILAYRALSAPRRSYRRTEAWVLMGRVHDLPEDRAQAVFSGIMAETYWWFAQWAAAIALVLWLTDFALLIIGA